MKVETLYKIGFEPDEINPRAFEIIDSKVCSNADDVHQWMRDLCKTHECPDGCRWILKWEEVVHRSSKISIEE